MRYDVSMLRENVVSGAKILLVLALTFFLLKACFSGGETYEPPINGQYNSPSDTTYEEAKARIDRQPTDPSKEIGRSLGEAFAVVKEAFTEFGSGVRDGANR